MKICKVLDKKRIKIICHENKIFLHVDGRRLLTNKQANGNRKVAGELLGIGRTTLYSKLEEYGLKYKFQQP